MIGKNYLQGRDRDESLSIRRVPGTSEWRVTLNFGVMCSCFIDDGRRFNTKLIHDKMESLASYESDYEAARDTGRALFANIDANGIDWEFIA